MILLILFILLAPTLSWSATCTFGTDCYCDHVLKVGDPLYDSAILFCEDFEAPPMRSNTTAGITTASARGSGGTNAYGPWYDDTGMAGNRGHNSYWNKTYGNGTDGYLWANGQPSSPINGPSCGFALCTGMRVWHPTNLFEANDYTPRTIIVTQDSDFTAEIGSLTVPTNTADGGNGVFDGNASYGFRIPAGNTGGISGGANFSTMRNIGYTSAIAYSSNALTGGAWGTDAVPASWKGNEWGAVYTGLGLDGLFNFYNQHGPRSGIPFAGFIGSFAGNTSNCGTQVVRAGVVECGPDALSWNTPSGYTQATDWPMGTWGCVRGYIENAGLSNQRLRIWFQGPNDTEERLLIDFDFDATGSDNRNGYNRMVWNAYANTNAGGGFGYIATTVTTFRYDDNVHVRNGMPVSCAQIGFTGGGGGGSSTKRFSPVFLRK